MRRAVGATGRVLVTAGLLILLFVAYQLWGTGIYEARQQSDLKHQFASELAKARTTPATTTTTAATATTTPDAATTTTIAESAPVAVQTAPPVGQALGIIQIPRIGVDRAIVEGVGVPDLRKGPGHYPLTPLPGQLGNAAIAGHRTTYGAPFYNLDQVQPGDPIIVQTVGGTFRYLVDRQADGSGHLVVKPTAVSVIDPTPDPAHPGQDLATLTLTTCNPRYSARERLVVKATLDIPAGPPPVAPPARIQHAAERTRIDDAGPAWGTESARTGTILWALAVLILGGLWWWFFHRHRYWTTWFIGGVPFAIVLFFFYAHLERLLPGNY